MKVTFTPDISTWKTECTCARCSTKLEVNGDDVLYKTEKKTGYDERGGDSYSYTAEVYYIQCPNCDWLIEINPVSTKMPYLLCKKIQDKSKKVK